LEYVTPFSLDQSTTRQVFQVILSYRGEPFSLIEHLNASEREKIKTNSKSIENTLKGMMAQDRGDLKEAISFFLKALEDNPNKGQIKQLLALTYFGQSQIFYSQKNWPQAREALLKVIELNPSFPQAHINLGSVYYQEGSILEAASEWATAKEFDPENPALQQNLRLLENYFGQ
ncbi:MAG: tetratricopeptide repeat protein, partial [bacterium]|nr:tetratricopeptide repeat protein [bacterium]